MPNIFKDFVTDLSSDFSSSKPAATAQRTFLIEKSKSDPAQLSFIYDANYGPNSRPVWSIINNKAGNPDVLIYQGESHPNNVFGDSKISSLSGSATLSLRGIPVKLKKSSMSDSYSVETQQHGKMKWKPNPMTGSGLQLHDSSGMLVAKFQSPGFASSGPKQLLVFVPADEFMMDLIVLSGMTIKLLKRQENEAAGEIIQAVAGS